MGSEVIPTLDPGRQERSGTLPSGMPRYIRFGAFILDQHRQELYKNGTRLKLQGKAYQVLLTLIERAGDVVTREELRQRLWPADTYVNFDANVNTTVNKLRQGLGDSHEQPLYIETIPRKGYCFVAAIEPAEAPTPHRASHPAVVPPPPAGETTPGTSFSLRAVPGSLWLTFGVAALVAAGMILGAGVAMFWMTHSGHFSPLP